MTWFPTVAAALGYAYTLSGRIPEALRCCQQAVGQDPSKGISAGHARRVAYLSEAYLLAGRRDEAADLATSALTFARTLQARGNEAYALWLHGEIHAQQESLASDAAEAYYCRPSRWPGNSGCVRSRPIATWRSVPCLLREVS